MDDLSKIISELPNILQYFVPGFLLISIFNSIVSKSIDKGIKFIMSCILSFAFIAGVKALISLFKLEITDIWSIVAITTLFSILFAILFAKIYACG